jgi:hypothetical protein
MYVILAPPNRSSPGPYSKKGRIPVVLAEIYDDCALPLYAFNVSSVKIRMDNKDLMYLN